MGYTLTSEETIRKARQLALRTGRTVDEAIDEAISEKLSRATPVREETPEEHAARKARLKASFEELEKRVPPVEVGDYDAELYDENGLWK